MIKYSAGYYHVVVLHRLSLALTLNPDILLMISANSTLRKKSLRHIFDLSSRRAECARSVVIPFQTQCTFLGSTPSYHVEWEQMRPRIIVNMS
jgi:hypothetical protein